MNKNILLQSVKTVSGFLALLSIGLFVMAWGIQNYPVYTVPVLITIIFSYMVWMEYKTRMDKLDREIMKRLKDGIK